MAETFEITSPDLEVEEIMDRIRKGVEEKRRRGVYDRYPLTGACIPELPHFRTEEEFLEYGLEGIWRRADIDLGDFEIKSKTPLLGIPVVWLKKLIWKLLKFYTYRLFSQQKEFNAVLAGIVGGLNQKLERRLGALEEKIKRLEAKLEDR